jgi:Mce-associated membrane protein
MERRQRPVAGQRARARATTDTGGRPQDRASRRPEHRPAATTVLDHPETRTEPSARKQRGEPRPRPSGRRRATVAIVLGVTVVLVATAVLLGYRVRQDARAEDARSAALAAGQASAADILSYDHRTLDRDFARARDAITGSFADDYAATTEKVVRPSAEKYKASVKAEVAAASVVSASADRATILLFVNQTTTSTRLDAPKVDLNRVRMDLVSVGGEWKVSDIDAL